MDNRGVEVLVFEEAGTPAGLRKQVRELQEEAWPSAPGTATPLDGPVHDPALAPVSMLLVDEGTVLAALDILSKPIAHAGRQYLAGGLSTVVTRADSRGRGLGRCLVRAARDAMAERDLDLGLFTCDRPLQAFYESAGWQLLPGTALIGGTPDSPFASDQPGFDKVTMAAFFSPKAQRAASPFRDTRIALYPGSIDKLW